MYIRNILCRGLLLTVILSLFSCEKDNEDLDCKYEKDYAPCGIEWMGDDLIVREEGNRRLTLVNSVSLEPTIGDTTYYDAENGVVGYSYYYEEKDVVDDGSTYNKVYTKMKDDTLNVYLLMWAGHYGHPESIAVNYDVEGDSLLLKATPFGGLCSSFYLYAHKLQFVGINLEAISVSFQRWYDFNDLIYY